VIKKSKRRPGRGKIHNTRGRLIRSQGEKPSQIHLKVGLRLKKDEVKKGRRERVFLNGNEKTSFSISKIERSGKEKTPGLGWYCASYPVRGGKNPGIVGEKSQEKRGERVTFKLR